MTPRPRLHRQIWLGFTVVAGLVAVTTATLGRMFGAWEPDEVAPAMIGLAQHVARSLPASPNDADMAGLSAELSMPMSLYRDGRLIASAGPILPLPSAEAPTYTWAGGPGVCVPVSQGTLCAAAPRHGGGPSWHGLSLLIGLVAIIGVASYPIARRITRRLGRLEAAVQKLGEGDLTARVRIGGRDEIAELAHAFNRSAERVEALVVAQRRTLANASHELRSPLARLRLAIEMDDPEAKAEIVANIAELDVLIGELLLQSRMEARALALEEVSVAALAVEEATRYGATVSGEGTWRADRAALRRLLRNLLENAQKYGAAPITVTVSAERLTVSDAGSGVPEAERERIFEPFYRREGHSESLGGAGLGLALVRQIAQAHGWTVRYVHPGQFVVAVRIWRANRGL